jgi:epoxyqueuosine reductase
MNQSVSMITEFLNSLPISKWGVADIAGLHPLGREYPRAVSLAMAYKPPFEQYDEAVYYRLLTETRDRLEEITGSISSFLQKCETKSLVFQPQTGMAPRKHTVKHMVFHGDRETLRGDFSHKLPATRAGLGWIGKSSLLVTEEFGPRVRLATVLIDADLPCGTPIVESRCGDCRLCIDACPYGSLRGADWYPGIDRELLIDAKSCYSERDKYQATLGRRHACGICAHVCPKGGSG